MAVYTGSFDPVTLGHLNVIQRGSRLFDRLIVGIGVNAEKQAMFSPEERIELIRSVTCDLPNIEIRPFYGLAVSFVHECQARVMIRGIRPLTDIPAEFTMMLANRELDPDVETVFLMADQSLVHVSSPDQADRPARRRPDAQPLCAAASHPFAAAEAGFSFGTP